MEHPLEHPTVRSFSFCSPYPSYIAFFLSGAAGLIYEVCWIRWAGLLFGSTLYGLSTVLAGFFLGLAIGSELFGRISIRTSKPLRLYAFLEACLASSALLTLFLFPVAETIFGCAYRTFPEYPLLLSLARFLLISLILLPPTTLMGATLPLMCRQFVVPAGGITKPVGFLYGLNTLGAAAGCTSAGLLLLPAWGISTAIVFGALLHLLSAVLAAGSALPIPPGSLDCQEKISPVERRSVIPAFVLLFFVGFTALAYEVIWTRFLSLLLFNTIYTYVLSLATILFGIVIGSLAVMLFSDRIASNTVLFGVLQMLSGISVLAVMLLPVAVWHGIGNHLAVYALLMLPAAILCGASFPIGVRMVISDSRLAGAGAGRVAAFNTLGGIGGSLLTGFILLPGMGLHLSLMTITGLSMAIGFAALTVFSDGLPKRRHIVWGALGVLLWGFLPLISATRIPADFLGKSTELVEFKEGRLSHLAILRKNGALQLEIDRMWQGQNIVNHQIMAAHIPMWIHPNPQNILVVGLGVGQTAGRFLFYDIRRLDCVDIEPDLFDLIPRHFEAGWMKDKRVELLSEDGRNYIAHTDRLYDLISIEVGQAFRPGVPAFYTSDFYRQAHARLTSGGIVSQFIPLLALPPEAIPGILASFLEVFPQSLLWYNSSEVLLIGMATDRLTLPVQRLEFLLRKEPIGTDLKRYNHWGGSAFSMNRPEVLLSGFLCGPRGLSLLAGEATAYRDDHPKLDYLTANVSRGFRIDTQILDRLSGCLDPLDSLLDSELSAEMLSTMEQYRHINLGQMRAGALIQQIGRLRFSWDEPSIYLMIEQAAQACPEYGDAARLMGEALLHRGRIEEGKSWLARAVAINPQDALAHRDLGQWWRTEPTEQAISHLQVALSLMPNDAETHYQMGMALLHRGKKVEAYGHFRQALHLQPDNSEIIKILSRIKPLSQDGNSIQ